MWKSARLGVVICLLAAQVCAQCVSQNDCTTLQQCQNSVCVDVSLSTTNIWRVVAATFVLIIAAALAAGGGLGGGGIFVPVFILILGLDPKQAIPLSQVTIFAGSLVNLAFNVRLKSPVNPKNPLIDFNSILVLEPMLLAGTIVGVILNIVSPSWLLVLLLMVTLTYASFRSIQKAKQQWKIDSTARIQRLRASVGHEKGDCLEVVDRVPEKNHDSDNFERAPPFIDESDIQKIERRPVFQVAMIVVIWIIVSGFSFSRSEDAGVQSCSQTYWILTASSFTVLCLLSVGLGFWLYRLNTKKILCGWRPIVFSMLLTWFNMFRMEK